MQICLNNFLLKHLILKFRKFLLYFWGVMYTSEETYKAIELSFKGANLILLSDFSFPKFYLWRFLSC